MTPSKSLYAALTLGVIPVLYFMYLKTVGVDQVVELPS